MRCLTVLLAACALAVTTACGATSTTSQPAADESPSAAPSDAQLSEQALAVEPPPTVAPEQVEDVQVGSDPSDPFSGGDATDAYEAAVEQFTVLRQMPGLLLSRPKTEADFRRVLDVSAPEHDAFMREQIASYLDSAANGGSRTDEAAKAAGDTLKGALTIVEPVDGGRAGAAGDPGTTAFRRFDPEAGAFAPIRISRTAAYHVTDTSGRTALVVAFDAVVPYHVIGLDGAQQTLQITITDFRMVMQEVGTVWEWDGWDMADIRAELLPRA